MENRLAVPQKVKHSYLMTQKFRGFTGGTVVQWLRIHVPVQEMQRWVQYLVNKFPWSRKWQLVPVFLTGKFHGERKKPGGLQSMGSQRVRHDWVTEYIHTTNSKRNESTKYYTEIFWDNNNRICSTYFVSKGREGVNHTSSDAFGFWLSIFASWLGTQASVLPMT